MVFPEVMVYFLHYTTQKQRNKNKITKLATAVKKENSRNITFDGF